MKLEYTALTEDVLNSHCHDMHCDIAQSEMEAAIKFPILELKPEGFFFNFSSLFSVLIALQCP